MRAEQFLRAAQEEITLLAGRSFDIRLVKIVQLIAIPNIQAARAAVRVARHIDRFPVVREVEKVEDGQDEADGEA